MEIEKYLEQLGLAENEIKVYLACLEGGESILANLAQKVNMPRSTTQYILEKLSDKRLVEIVQKESRHIYIPYPPRSILTLLKNKQEKLEEEIQAFEASLPELTRIFSSVSFLPKVRFFQDKEIVNIYEEILNSPIDETLFIGEMSRVAEAVGKRYLQNWMKRRVERNIKTRAVRVKIGEFEEDPIINAPKGYLRNVRLAPDGFESPSHIIIYGDHVAIITTTKENFGVVITSREFATTMKNCFKEVWKNSRDNKK